MIPASSWLQITIFAPPLLFVRGIIVRLATFIDIITLQTFNLFEFLLERLGQIVALLFDSFIFILQILLDD